ILVGLDVARAHADEGMSVDRKLGRAGRREDDLPGPRQQAGGDLESRVLLADDEDAAVGIGLDRTQLAVVRDLGNSRNRGSKPVNGWVQLSIRWKTGQRRNMPPGASSCESTACSMPRRRRQ